MAEFSKSIETLLRHEGGFATNDNGRGAVNWGWTSQTLAGLGEPSTVEDVRRMSRDRAIHLYRVYYWGPLQLDEIKEQRLATLILSMAVNKQGPGKSGPAVRALQVSINDCLEDREALQRVAVDGVMGRETLKAVNGADQNRLLSTYKARLAGEYKRLALARPELYADDLNGWLRRLEELTA